MPVKFRVREHNDFIKYRRDLGVQVALNIVQTSRGCSYMTKLYSSAVPQFSHRLIGKTILWMLQVLFFFICTVVDLLSKFIIMHLPFMAF